MKWNPTGRKAPSSIIEEVQTVSHYIEDDKKVVKTSRGYIFMCLGGDNNVSATRS